MKRTPTPHILIVSREGFLRRMVACLLEGTGARVVCAGSWHAARELPATVVEGLAVVVLLGARLWFEGARPRVAAVGSTASDRNTYTPPSLRPRIFVLAWDQSEESVRALLENGVDQYLTLPLHPHRLCGKVHDEVVRWRARQEARRA